RFEAIQNQPEEGNILVKNRRRGVVPDLDISPFARFLDLYVEEQELACLKQRPCVATPERDGFAASRESSWDLGKCSAHIVKFKTCIRVSHELGYIDPVAVWFSRY